jgi:putative addiction module component (TIGR02574 family)
MSAKLDQVSEMAMSLEPAERAELAERLVGSLPSEESVAIDAAWAEEAERRIDEFWASGEKGIPLADALREAESKLRR